MANVMTDQLLGTLLGSRPPGRGATDEELLEALTSQAVPMAPDPVAEPTMVAPPEPAVASQSFQAGSAPMPRVPSRTEQLMNTLQRPGSDDGVIAGVLDSLVGGDKWTSELRARRNMFDQAMLGAQAADVSSEERAAEAELGRGMQRDQMALTQRGQDLADKRAEEQRKMQEYLLGLRLGATSDEKEKDRLAALEREKLRAQRKPAGDGLAPARTPEEQEAREMGVASWLSAQANVPLAKARAFMSGNVEGISPDEAERLQVNYSQFQLLAPKEQRAAVTKGLTREGATPDATAAAIEKKKLDPKQRLALKDEIGSVGQDIALAKQAWAKMSDTAKQVFVKYAGAGGDIAQTIKSAVLSPEDQKYSGQLQSLANALIKARSGSAVTGSEWNRVAQEIGWPTGDFSLFNTTAGVDGWLDKSKRAWVNRVKNVKSEYGDIWSSDGGQ
jgi:hypothetical protein